MPATVNQILDGLVARLNTIAGLRCYDRPADIQAVPSAYIMLESIDYQGSFALGNAQHQMTVTVVVGRISDRAAYQSLSDYCATTGTKSIRAAIEADRTLGGNAQTLVVQRADNVRALTQGDADYLAVDFAVLVHA